MKNLLRESTDPYMALLTYRSTPLPWCGLSPAELLMGRCLRTNLPQVVDRLKPTWQYIERFRKKDKEFKDEQKRHDQRHKCRPLPDIPDGSKVWVMDGDIPTPATVTHQVEATTACSYDHAEHMHTCMHIKPTCMEYHVLTQ